MFELCLREKNGFFCPECGKKIESSEIVSKLHQWEEEYKDQLSELNEEQ